MATQLRKIILEYSKQNKSFSTKDILSLIKNVFSRQHVSRTLSALVKENKLIKTGATRNAKYSHAIHWDWGKNNLDILSLRKKNQNLEEHKILEEIERELPTIKQIPEHLSSILTYAFSEMFNNAIEHSKSKIIEIDIGRTGNKIFFEIRDFGIGVFKSIISKTSAKTELEAIQELLKGKLTTAPKLHSGEGIFFTSKAGELFIIESFTHKLTINNRLEDIFIESPIPKKTKGIQGTMIRFELDLNHKAHLSDVFQEHQSDPSSLEFDKTEIKIKLYTMGTIHISRSQARRVLNRLEKFRKVILDFDKVPTVGQAFADEIFRVFKEKYPEVEIIPENMNEAVEFMVERAQRTKR
ncbi:DUF4325 domain-containing protein [Candidatus Peregrinibacteria bacterium]|jgi:anti-sigma regulatory factor (Ser/Thr protein kinase)|nr:DUF4325 domain-containing protein [Candidatus Peregrinibacteria bacterium]MBT4056515.1 DUF4325 domain-containing protein [Candidatus Peregrinibacteria bacterium]